ncbi:hypothetical protein L1987_24102 [Smallanthus sonchifolius]|uniref:Uncharacterized protein n=2 Tax=Smallanthus sonchifolius TaxID=185202 RepID=A0ACB9IL08_9ASTR|nr:hypothetical protein L1987_24102 [Smallanthus sonchifolius]
MRVPPQCAVLLYQADYIGIVQNKFDGRTTRNDRYLRVLEDRNNQDISLTIWKETLATFDSAAPATTSTQVTTFAGRLHLATTAASSLYLNPAISIGQTLINGPGTNTSSSSSYACQSPIHTYLQTETTLASLAQKQMGELAGLTFTCTALIIQYTEGMTCLDTPKFMFRLSAIIADETGTATVIIFDRIAKQLVQKEVSDLVTTEKYDNPQVIPPPFLALRQQTKKFHLRTSDNKRCHRAIFTVSKVSEATNTTGKHYPHHHLRQHQQQAKLPLHQKLQAQKYIKAQASKEISLTKQVRAEVRRINNDI